MEENPSSKFAYKLYWGHMKENEHTVTAQRLMFTLFFFNFVTNFQFFHHLLVKPYNVFLCKTHSNKLGIYSIANCKLHYILVWNILNLCLCIWSWTETWVQFLFFLSLIQYALWQTLLFNLLQWITNVPSHSVVCFDISVY